MDVSSTTQPQSMINLLRAQTATHHHGLESGLRIQERLSGADTRGPLIAGYNRFYSKCEAALEPHLWDISDLTFSFRFRSRKIPGTAELACRENPWIDLSIPSIGTKAKALGAMYVLEGSTLGGKTILKTLSRHGVATEGLHFLDPYGKDAGALWRAFVHVLERETESDQTARNECVSGAMDAFTFAAVCLREEGTN
jgi:heme oxygenase (biliverdin-IX-beta and delta-forming)